MATQASLPCWLGIHLGTARLYGEVRTAIEDMNHFLDSDALRRQGETMVRLTVVTTFGLIGVMARCSG